MDKPLTNASQAAPLPHRIPTRPPTAGSQIKRSGLVEEVFHRIRGDIMSLAIPPNAKVSVDSLVRELGVSQTPIREALSMLEAIGLVHKKHFTGYYTAPMLDRKQFDHLYELRMLMEPYAAERAATHIDSERLGELCRLALQMEPHTEGATRDTYNQFADEDSQFHSLIAQGSGNPLISEALDRLHVHLHIFRLRFSTEVTREAHTEHAQVILALQQRDAQAAKAAMRNHLERSYARLAQFAAGV